MDAADGLRVRRAVEGVEQIGDRLGVPALIVGEDAPVQRGRRQVGVDLEGATVVAPRRLGPAEGLGGQPAVEVALGGVGPQRDAGAKGGDGLLEVAEAVGAEALVEVRPEVLGPELERPAELLGGPRNLVGAEVGPSQVVVLPGRARGGPRRIGRFGTARGVGGRPALAVDSGARSERRLGFVEHPQGVLMRLGDGARRCEPDPETGQDEGQLEQVGPDLLLGLGGERAVVRHEEDVAPVPDRPAEAGHLPGILSRGGGDSVAEADEVGQAVELGGLQAPPRPAELHVEVVRQVTGEGVGEGDRPGDLPAALQDLDGFEETALAAELPAVGQRGLALAGALVSESDGQADRHDDGGRQREQGRPPRQGAGAPPSPLVQPLDRAVVCHPAERLVVEVPAEVVGEGRRVAVAVGRCGGQAFPDDVGEPDADPGVPELPGPAGRPVRRRAGAAEGLAEQQAQRVEVGEAVDGPGDRPSPADGHHRGLLLGRHPAGRPPEPVTDPFAGRDRAARQVEVEEHRLAVARDQDVRGLDVHVDQAPGVGILQASARHAAIQQIACTYVACSRQRR